MTWNSQGLRYQRCRVAPQTATPSDHALNAARDAVVGAWRDGTYGFLGCPDADAAPYEQWSQALLDVGAFDTQVVIGIGGSSLGARAILASATAPLHGLRTHFSENMDPIAFRQMFDQLDLRRTLFVVVTKSGSTIETMSKFWFVWQKLGEVVPQTRHKHVIAITDPEHGQLRELATQLELTTFDVPANVGGRFSVLTAVGLVPLALAGYPVRALLEGARDAREHALSTDAATNATLRAAADHVALAEHGATISVMMAYSDLLGPLVEWFCQLWGESLAKARTRSGAAVTVGLTPVKAVGAVDQHSQLQLFMEGPRDKHIIFVEVEDFGVDVEIPTGLQGALAHLSGKSMSSILTAELRGTRAALQQDERAFSSWVFDAITPRNVGAFILSWELITAVVGELWDIDAFDQPGVELGKKIAHGLLGRAQYEAFADLASTAEDAPLQVV